MDVTLSSIEDDVASFEEVIASLDAACPSIEGAVASFEGDVAAIEDKIHSAHHRAQLVVYLRLLGRPIYSTYGPTGDTGGLPIQKAPTIYRYEDIDDLLASESECGRRPDLPGPSDKSPTERPQ